MPNLYTSIASRIGTVCLLAAPGAVVALFLLLNTHGYYSIDGYYHHAVTEEFVVSNQFPWLPETVFAESYSDYHFLFHVILYPFILLGGVYGAHLYIILTVLLLSFILYRFLSLLEVPQAAWWSIFILMVSTELLARLTQLRPN